MKKSIVFALMAVLLVTVAGCAKKTASEQLQEDMKKASDQLNREAKAWK